MSHPYELPTHRLRQLGESEQAFLETLERYPPRTKWKKGDLGRLRSVPHYMLKRPMVPVIWQVRFIISLWTYEAYSLGNTYRNTGAWDDALYHYKGDVFSLIHENARIPPAKFQKPVLYCHGFPHGDKPDSAGWFYEDHLVRHMTRAPTEEWPSILDQAGAPYQGFDLHDVPNGVCLDLAPDLYKGGQAIGRPFDFEEPAYQTLCTLGFENATMQDVDPRFYTPSFEETLGLV